MKKRERILSSVIGVVELPGGTRIVITKSDLAESDFLNKKSDPEARIREIISQKAHELRRA